MTAFLALFACLMIAQVARFGLRATAPFAILAFPVGALLWFGVFPALFH